ncbi:DUF1801 domain-containing protein [Nitriliruptor alkaliphilus]|uniref:DUF1801 domain-containing protein n=1 Tax=Nitriliruptor alkaliphilus TaxID=427918 RepID=UPI000695FC40|nr:DUF1801 domain-containing protein [Nitriliruptor alkaliphilus]
MVGTEVETVWASHDPTIRALAERVRALVRQVIPDATEEADPSAGLIGFTTQPGTYRGLIVAVAPHTAHVNLMFSRGVELLDADGAELLEGTGKRARHVRFRGSDDVDRPGVRTLLEEAARRHHAATPPT